MKPDWNDAPESANWFAQDQDGPAYWYENEPARGSGGEYWIVTTGRSWRANVPDWLESKEQRPQQDKPD